MTHNDYGHGYHDGATDTWYELMKRKTVEQYIYQLVENARAVSEAAPGENQAACMARYTRTVKMLNLIKRDVSADVDRDIRETHPGVWEYIMQGQADNYRDILAAYHCDRM